MAKVKPQYDASYFFRFIGDVWLLLPEEDKLILSNFWASLVMTTGSMQMTAFEYNLSYSVLDISIYNDDRWLSYDLSASNQLVPSPIANPSGIYYSFFLGDSRVASIPTLQERIDAPKYILKEGTDYFIQDNMIHFVSDPTQYFFDPTNPRLWAKDTFLNKNFPYRNFGVLIDLFQENSQTYLNIIQGLWYAYWTGPRIENIKTSLYLLFNLPTAPFRGRVTSIVLADERYIEVTSESTGEVSRLIVLSGLNPIVQLGQSVEKFDVLCTGINVIDKVSNPNFLNTEIGRQGINSYLTQYATTGLGDTDETKAMTLLKEHLWMAQISGDAFVSKVDVPAIRNFLSNIKPAYTDFIFQVLEILDDYFELDEEIVSKDIDMDITVYLDNSPVNYITEDRYNEYEQDGNIDLDIDMDTIMFTETTDIEVRNGGVLVDSFAVSM